MISILLQARMSSSRLPGKVMREINGKPMLDYLLERVKKCKKVQDIILIIPDGKEDDVLETWCIKSGVDYYRGNEDNLLERFYKAAIKFNVSTIVRLTGDNPLIDSELIDQVIELYSSSNYDFVSNAVPLPTSYPIGMSVEVFGLSCLVKTYQEAKLPSEIEHVTFYMWKNNRFKIKRMDSQEDLSRYRLTVDYKEDFILIEKIFAAFNYSTDFSYEQLIDFLKRNPQLGKLQKNIENYDGWKKSFLRDKQIQL